MTFYEFVAAFGAVELLALLAVLATMVTRGKPFPRFGAVSPADREEPRERQGEAEAAGGRRATAPGRREASRSSAPGSSLPPASQDARSPPR